MQLNPGRLTLFVFAVGPVRAEPPIVQHRNPARYHIEQSIEVRNDDVSKLGLLELNIAVPVDAPGQRIENIRVMGDNFYFVSDIHGLGKLARCVYPDTKRPVPGQARKLAVTYDLTCSEITTDRERLLRRRYPPYDRASSLFRVHTASEKSIEVGDPAIVDVARRLAAGNDGPYHFAKAVYDYVIEHVAFATPSPSHTAKACLASGKGDCGAYTLLFVALCRAGGVPARAIAGCWAEGENNWHCWAEFYLPGVGWVPVDPTRGDADPTRRDYYFGNMDNNRVVLARTFNFTAPPGRGSTDVGFVQVGTWWWQPAPGSTGSKMTVTHRCIGRRIGE